MNPAIIEATKRQIERLLEAFPELSEDDDFRRDALEGETDFTRIMDRLAKEVRLAKHKARSLAQFKAEVEQKIGRSHLAEERLRETMKALMDAAGLTKLRTDTAAISIGKPPASVIITEAADIPRAFVRIKAEPDKKAIKEALEAGNHVPGAVLSNPEPVLRVS